MQKNFKSLRAGVSLIAVLLFMLIATIAATATWKWITSEGKSSASRMLKREAYQSSIAGIENARAWMTYHANDVGALIRQYIDGGKNPINLDAQLRSLQKADQSYHVWLTGVNVESNTYKLKIYSAGEARGGNARHNEVAILNVSGLYRINIPQDKHSKKADFDYNYFGGSTSNHGDVFARSMLINGDLLNGNPASIDSNLVVTGNFKVSGNSIAVHGTACIGGNLDADNGLVGNNFYVEGDLKNLKIRPLTAHKGSETINLGNKIYGNVFVNGNITAANGDQVIDGNLTLNGRWTTNMSGYNAGVRGNLCVGESGQIYFPNQDREFKGGGSVWMESDYPIWTGNDNYNRYNRIVLGAKDKPVYIKTGHPWSDYKTLREQTYAFTETDGTHFGWGSLQNEQDDRKWTGEKNMVFVDKKTKPGLHYLYNWTSSVAPVSLGAYTDYYKDWPEGKNLLVYKLNGVDGDETRFWDSWHDDTYQSLNITGNQISGSPYCAYASGGPGSLHAGGLFGAIAPAPLAGGSLKNKARPSCGVTPWFKVDGDFKTTFPGSKPESLTCAESVKAHCDSLWEPTGGCGSAKYLVPDALKTGISYFESYANRAPCVTTLLAADKNNFNFSQFSACYDAALESDETAHTNYLYNKYLVIKVTNNNIFTSSQGTLDGKFLFIFENDIGEMVKLPAMASSDAYAFIYFKDGLSGTLMPADNTAGMDFNYFIYTKNDIQNALFNTTVLKGSIYAAVIDETTGAKNCAKVSEMTFNNGMDFNPEMIADLTDANIICSNDGSACGGVNDGTVPSSTSGTDEEDSEYSEHGKDRYFISMAPQLGVTVESRYEAEERRPSGSTIQTVGSSYLILPRVIYLPSDPYGKLQDYYNVVPLNGAGIKKSDVTSLVSCSGSSGTLPTTSNLFTGTPLIAGIYKCEVQPSGYDKMPFWVVVGKSQRGDGDIWFEKPSQMVGATTESPIPVKVVLSPHSTKLTVNVNCPDVPNSAWKSVLVDTYYKGKVGTVCEFEFPKSESLQSYTLFNVSTTNATEGMLTYTLLPGEGFTLSSPYYIDLVVASTATINRSELGIDLSAYCTDHPGVCPTGGSLSDWPDCSYSGLWVEPQATATTVVTNDINESWSVSVGGDATIKLVDRSQGHCVVIIPEGTDNELQKTAIEANKTYTLKAVAKAKNRTLRIAFMGDVEGHVPEVDYSTNGGRSGHCVYTGVGLANACAVSVFDGEEISLSIDSTLTQNENFSYWQCYGESCPDQNNSPMTSKHFDSFSVNDDATVVYVHFGESDKHCFIDEFKDNNVACRAGNVEYCIDVCDNVEGVCEGVEDSKSTYTKSKWHLLSGKFENLEVYAGHISMVNKRNVSRGVNNKNNTIKIISTVTAGLNGNLKALFRMPQATLSYGRSSENIAKSGFMLRSNATGTEYLMLNMYVNTSGHLEAQVCTDAGSCLNGELKQNGSSISVSTASMVMMTASLNVDNTLVISAFTGSNYYGTPSEYTYTFNLSGLTTSYVDRAHEYVGFSLADPDFKIYGIGWESFEYSSDCWDTPPSVKCSFAAKAHDGIIELNKDVVPWVGHSGWFDSRSCTPHYYYFNGSDAGCGTAGATGIECPLTGYKFTAEGQGQHGYGNDMKTAKAALKCLYASNTDELWISSTQTEAALAHCGAFWTGAFSECSEHATLVTEKILDAGTENLDETVVVQGSRFNLRGATLNVVLENPDHNEVEIVLVSKHDFDEAEVWGDWKTSGIYMSRSVKVSGNTGSFDVVEDMAKGAEGFDPEKIRSIILKNHGMSSVTVKSITANCKHAVGVASCSAEYKDEDASWHVSATINNIASATTIKTTSKVEGNVGQSSYECGKTGVNCTKTEGSSVVDFVIPDNPYVNQGKSYLFSVSASNGTVTNEAACTVTPDPIGAISRECRANPQTVQQGKGMPQFQFTLNGCPNAGCAYQVYVNNEQQTGLSGFAKSGEPVKVTPAMNSESSALDVGTYTYKVASTGTQTPFEDCSATFTVTEQKTADEAVRTTCSFQGNDTELFQPGASKAFQFVVIDNNAGVNISGRNFKLTLPDGNVQTGSTGSGSVQTVMFNTPDNGGTATLEVWDQGVYKTSCTAELRVKSIAPSNCRLINNNATFRAHFDNTCTNGACPWELKKTLGTTVTTFSSGNVQNNDIDVNVNGLGIYTMWVNGTEYESCSVMVGPNVTCPVTTSVLEVGKENSLYMTALSNCNNEYGCNYTFVPEVGLQEQVTDGSYKNASTAIKHTPTSAQNGIGYTFTVTSAADAKLTSSCTGTMNVVEAITCTQISKTISGSNTNFSVNSGKLQNGCADVTVNGVCSGRVQIELDPCNGQTGTWNGTSFTLNTNANGYYEFSANPAPMATTFKLNVPACPDANINKIYVDGCSELTAATQAPSVTCPNNHSKYPGSAINIPVANCNVVGGCSYTITKNDVEGPSHITYGNLISIPGDASGTSTYKLSISNSVNVDNAQDCEFTVTYSENAYESVVFGTRYEGPIKIKLSTSYNICGFTMSSASWSDWIESGASERNTWNGNGEMSVTSTEVKMFIPNGQWININNCWN